MARDRQEYRVELDAGLGSPGTHDARQDARELDDTPFRIALVGDFTGRANRDAVERGRSLTARCPIRVDRDNVDDLLASLAPELLLPLDSNGPSSVRFTELDDFHPDRLYGRLPGLRALREARERAMAPPSVVRANRSNTP